MSGPAPDEVTIPELVDALFEAIQQKADAGMVFTTGQAMGALFTVFVNAAQGSPEYDPKRLVADVDARIREAVGLQ